MYKNISHCNNLSYGLKFQFTFANATCFGTILEHFSICIALINIIDAVSQGINAGWWIFYKNVISINFIWIYTEVMLNYFSSQMLNKSLTWNLFKTTIAPVLRNVVPFEFRFWSCWPFGGRISVIAHDSSSTIDHAKVVAKFMAKTENPVAQDFLVTEIV